MSCAIRTQVVHTLRRAKTLRAPRYRGQRQFWSDMPAGASSILWFEELFGFREGGSYRENRAKFRMEGDVLCVDGAPKYKKHFVGRWSTPSVAELCAPPYPAATAQSEEHVQRTGCDDCGGGHDSVLF
mgnify:CR=1 FL=1